MQPDPNRRDASDASDDQSGVGTDGQSRAVVTARRRASALARRRPRSLAVAGRRAGAVAAGAAALGAAALGAITVGGTIGGAWRRRTAPRAQRASRAADGAPEPVALVVQMSVLVIEHVTATHE